MSVYDLLPEGRENAIAKADLRDILCLDDRTLRKKVQQERAAGFQILTNCEKGGYYRPANEAETVQFIRSMQRRSRETAAIAEAMERTLAEEAGQQRLEGL